MRIIISLIVVFVSFCSNGQTLEIINTSTDELNPVLAPDGYTLYFTRANHPLNIGGANDPGDIWISHRQKDGTWSIPKHADNALNSRGWNGILGFSKDGSVMYLHHHYSAEGRPKSQGISYSKKVGLEWSKPVNISIPYFKNISPDQSGWISGEENILLISVEGYYTRGAEDIYVILRNADGTWRDAINLGNQINTPFQEFSPTYNPIDSTIYFSSNGHGGFGSFDVFMAKRLDNTWTNWSKPVPLGDSINSQGREISFINYPSRNQALYSSTKNSDGYGDIKTHQYGALPTPGTQQLLFVVDERTGEKINAEVNLYDSLGENYSKFIDTRGYDLSSFAKGPYYVQVSAQGYLPQEQELNLQDSSEPVVIALKPVEKGTRVVLKNVLFELSKAELLPQSYNELDQVVKLMNDNPELKIRLEGHTDTRGSAKANLKLSQKRVEAVKDYLIDKGISKRRIEGKGFGGAQPLFTDDSEENRMKNRRVEFIIVSN